MKKTIDINLAGFPFKIDEDAYILLQEYLEKIRMFIDDESIVEEVIFDVESRIVELMEKHKHTPSKVIQYQMVAKAIKIIGNAENFSTSEKKETDVKSERKHFTKKLFRNPKNKIVAGVISGICEYYGIKEPIIFRVLFVLLLFFSFGTPILIYIICWILIPEAQTPSDFIQMKGGDINIQNIEKEIKQAFHKTANKVESWKEPIRKWDLSSRIAGLFELIAKIVVSILLLICIGLIILGIVFFFGLFTISFSSGIVSNLTNIFFVTDGALYLINICGVLVYAIPLFWIVFVLISFLLNRKSKGLAWAKITSGIIWGIALFYIITQLVIYVGSFKSKEERVKNFEFEASQKEIVLVVQDKDNDNTWFFGKDNYVRFDDEDDNLVVLGVYRNLKHDNIQGDEEKEYVGVENMDISFYPSGELNEQKILIDYFLYARGKTSDDALKNLDNTLHDIEVKKGAKADTIYLDRFIRINKKGKWRNQKVKVQIGLPNDVIFKVVSEHGTKIKVYQSTREWLQKEHYKTYHSLTFGEFLNKENRIYCQTYIE